MDVQRRLVLRRARDLKQVEKAARLGRGCLYGNRGSQRLKTLAFFVREHIGFHLEVFHNDFLTGCSNLSTLFVQPRLHRCQRCDTKSVTIDFSTGPFYEVEASLEVEKWKSRSRLASGF